MLEDVQKLRRENLIHLEMEKKPFALICYFLNTSGPFPAPTVIYVCG